MRKGRLGFNEREWRGLAIKGNQFDEGIEVKGLGETRSGVNGESRRA
jgi:hypothetical protein